MRRPPPASVLVALFGVFVAYQFAASPAGVTPLASALRPGGAGWHALDDPASPVLGNPRGNTTVVEFFDYRCPYCRTMRPRLRELLAADPEIRLVMKEWPVFGGPSIEAARVALASAWQDKYAAMHDALFDAPPPLDAAAIRRAARRAGVDMARLDRDLEERRGELDRALVQNQAAARSLGLQGTPVFVVGATVIPGALSLGDLKGVIAKARPGSGAPR